MMIMGVVRMSSSYLIANVDFGNADQAAAYGRQVPQTVAKYGGRYLVRGGAAEVVEGAWRPTYMVVLEFPSTDRARAWYSSADYASLRTVRQASAQSDFSPTHSRFSGQKGLRTSSSFQQEPYWTARMRASRSGWVA